MQSKRILALWGGGARGVIQAVLLRHIEEVTGKPIHALFDLIAGTSTGSINGAAAAVGIPAREMGWLFTHEGPNIFPRRRWYHEIKRIVSPRYPSIGIDRALERNLRSFTMADCKTLFMATAVNLQTGAFKTFKSWHTDDSERFLKHVVRASAAAPTYLSPSPEGYVDGGLVANAPGFIALVEADRLWHDDPLCALSIGCGRRPRFLNVKAARRGGLSWWAPRIVDIVMDAGIDSHEHFARRALGDDYHSIQPILPDDLSADLDCVTPKQMAGLDALAREHFGEVERWLRKVELL